VLGQYLKQRSRKDKIMRRLQRIKARKTAITPSQKKFVMKLAARYRREGVSPSTALKRAWREMRKL